jgi:hypothetical protein
MSKTYLRGLDEYVYLRLTRKNPVLFQGRSCTNSRGSSHVGNSSFRPIQSDTFATLLGGTKKSFGNRRCVREALSGIAVTVVKQELLSREVLFFTGRVPSAFPLKNFRTTERYLEEYL